MMYHQRVDDILYSSSSKKGRELKSGTLRQELKQSPQKNIAYWLASPEFLATFLVQSRTISTAMETVCWSLPSQ